MTSKFNQSTKHYLNQSEASTSMLSLPDANLKIQYDMMRTIKGGISGSPRNNSFDPYQDDINTMDQSRSSQRRVTKLQNNMFSPM